MICLNKIFENSLAAFAAICVSMTPILATPALAEGQSHVEAYQQALVKVEHGQSRILREIYRIKSGEVAHFDFLQYEHIEVLRHARALQFPPSELKGELRSEIIDQAKTVLYEAEALEWQIADFLRGHALMDSAVSNTVDITALASRNVTEATHGALHKLGSAALQFQTRPEASTLQTLLHAFNTFMTSTELNSTQWRGELAYQQNLITMSAQQSENAIAAIEVAGLAREADAMVKLYRRTHGLYQY